MKISILLPHYRTPHITAYAVYKMLKHKGDHELELIVVNNSVGDNSIESLNPFLDQIKVVDFVTDKLSSHGVALEYGMQFVTNEYVVTAESDSFPIVDGYLDSYEELINHGYDAGGSLLKLSGGSYIHPAGSFYRKSIWQEAHDYCQNIEYTYFPNMSNPDGRFDCHLMVHNSILQRFVHEPHEYIEMANGYKGLSPEEILAKAEHYRPVVCAFHNGMGTQNETIDTYGQRTIESESPFTLLSNKPKLVNRIGLEPGQFLTYYMTAKGYKIAVIHTEIKWMKDRAGEQQEYTLMETGFKHLWGTSSYYNFNPEGSEDISSYKQSVPEQLYATLPEHLKVKI